MLLLQLEMVSAFGKINFGFYSDWSAIMCTCLVSSYRFNYNYLYVVKFNVCTLHTLHVPLLTPLRSFRIFSSILVLV